MRRRLGRRGGNLRRAPLRRFIKLDAAGVAQLVARRQYIASLHVLHCHVHVDPKAIEDLNSTANRACRSLTAEALLEFKAVGDHETPPSGGLRAAQNAARAGNIARCTPRWVIPGDLARPSALWVTAASFSADSSMLPGLQYIPEASSMSTL